MKAKTLVELYRASEKVQKIDKELQVAKRDVLLENMYISEDIDCEIYDKDDEMMILVVEAFNRVYISLRSKTIDIPDRCWVNADGTILVARGQDHPFLPVLHDGDNRWYCGDEIYPIGVWTEEDTQNYNMPREYNKETDKWENKFSHKNMMCIPKVKYYGVTDSTAEIIWERYGHLINENA